MNEKLTDAELRRLKGARDAAEWNKACDEVKAARGGEYPQDWYSRVVRPGVMAETASRFAG